MINCTSLTVNQRPLLRMSYRGNQFGTNYNFSCTIGYRLNGPSTVSCFAYGNKPSGGWDNPLPSCEGTRKKQTKKNIPSIQVKYLRMLQYVHVWFGFVMSCHSKCFGLTSNNSLFQRILFGFWPKNNQCWLSARSNKIKSTVCHTREHFNGIIFFSFVARKLLTICYWSVCYV